jgi:hypothetical protein
MALMSRYSSRNFGVNGSTNKIPGVGEYDLKKSL